jgi:hypothetical protein
MEPLESHTHSFIVKVWLEDSATEAGRPRWRGHITHVPGGERCYVQDPDSISAFVARYLERMGVKLGWRWRMRVWLSGLRPGCQ